MAATVAIGAALRIAGLFTDFWLDEILSYDQARRLQAPWEVLTKLDLDNNHPLNTLFLWLLGERSGWIAYRLPAVVAGLGTLLLIGLLERKRGRGAILAPLFFASFSPYLIVYSSEARGYAPAAFFALVAWWLLRDGRAEASRAGWLAFEAAVLLGILSHLTFLYPWLGLVAVSMVRVGTSEDRRRAVWSLIRLHAIPIAALATVWWSYARHLRYGGGPPFAIPEVLVRGVSTLFGGPGAGGWAWLAVVAATILVATEVVRLLAARDPEGVFFVVAIVVAPAAVLALYAPHYLDPRYFFTVMPFVLVAAGRSLARLAMVPRLGAVAATVLACGFLWGSLLRLAPFLQDGRGHPAAALRFIASSEPSGEITVGSDHDARTGTVFEFYRRREPDGARLRYVRFAGWTDELPEWAITHTMQPEAPPPPEDIRGLNGRRYRLEAIFPHGGFSGASWFVYRLAPRAEGEGGTR